MSVSAARRGSQEAAGEIFDSHAAALLQVACAVLRDDSQAEAVVADVIVRLCAGTAESVRAERLRHDLARLTYLRSVQRLPAVANGAETPAEHGGVLVAMTSLRELAGQQRAAIALVLVGDHTYLDVAQLMRLSPSRVVGLLHASLRDLVPLEVQPGRTPLVRRRHSSWALSEYR